MKRTGLSGFVIVAFILGIGGFVAIGFTTFQRDVAAMKAANLEDITWSASQLELEVERFMGALTRFQSPSGETTAADVNRRFDILWSRVALFDQGRVGARLAEYDKDEHVVANLFALLKTVDVSVVELQDGDNQAAADLLDEFLMVSEPVFGISRVVSQGEEARSATIRRRLQEGVNRTLIMSGLAIVISILALAFINRESVRYQKLASKNRKLADIAEMASRAKSRFLSMMSHELRTPMNGVIGLLAVAKQNENAQPQLRLIEQAEQSANQMVDLLADILDYSALQAGDIELEENPFELPYLAQSISDSFEPLIRKTGIKFNVTTAPGIPDWMVGDVARLRQCYCHLSQYIVETAGVGDTNLYFEYKNGLLLAILSFDYFSVGGAWNLDLILGNESRSDEKFASDALGPAIARGLVNAMSGEIRIDTCDVSRISIIVSIPLREHSVAALSVKVISNSDALVAICRAALQCEDLTFMQEGDNGKAHFALIEAGGEEEAGFLDWIKKSHPEALLIALGNPADTSAFDFELPLPLDFQELRDIVFCQTT